MADRRLRVYYGPDEDTQGNLLTDSVSPRLPAHKVTVSLGDVLDTLTEAVNDRRGWVRDFEDDQITISTDLYEVILAYQHFRRPSA